MTEKREHFQILYTEDEKTGIIMKNIVTMLSNRIYLDNGVKKQLVSKNSKYEDKNDGVFSVVGNDKNTYTVIIVFDTISSVGKQSTLGEFMRYYENDKKIVVIKNYNNKVHDYVVSNSSEIFKESALMQNIIDFVYQPKFELLTPKEMEQVKTEYNFKDKNFKIYKSTDPIVRYYNLQPGDIIRIIRPSPSSGFAIDYRRYESN
jgi:DNA-directed RNA polymerase I, II, and III subunit RPABC1